MKTADNERYTVSPYLVLVLIHSIQFGIGYLSMSVKPIQLAGQDAWISVLLGGIIFYIVIWMIYQILDHNKSDIIDIHFRFFGKWTGSCMNFIFIAYFLLNSIYQVRLFIEIIEVWLFPEIGKWLLALVLLLLTYYIIAGGFRVILGICALSLVQHAIILSLLFTAPFFHYDNLTPTMEHSFSEILKATKELTFPYSGVEILLFCYSFIKNPQKSQRWAQLGNLITTVFYLIIILISLLLFKYEQLSNEIWPELTKYKFVHMPFIERFDFIGATFVIFGLFPASCLYLWASSRIIKKTFGTRQVTILGIFLIFVFVVVCLIPDRNSIEMIRIWLSKFGIFIIYAYIPCMYVIDAFKRKARRFT
ncbi:GerAB/ArcD/ProY family transporter [Cohnella sp. GCM10020058]|uniref:GerAB/ArcD/ProY family transporter n=1 Tax=Cohnella sp. GCM10020058 TaxID=3317330 RepID=UPI0036392937